MVRPSLRSASALIPRTDADWHLHDARSHDGCGTPLEFALAARQRKLVSIGISNHIETYRAEDGYYKITVPEDLERLRESGRAVEEARRAFPELEIRFGVEVENHRAFYPATERILREVKFDYVIGSVHWVNDVCVTAGSCLARLKERSPAEWYRDYYRELTDFVEWGRFDYLGHPDVIRRYMVKAFPEFKPAVPCDVLRNVFTVMRERGQGIEINTGGLFHAPRDLYPTLEILELARECGIERIMTGSDAHCPEEIARGYESILERIEGTGLKGRSPS